MKIFGSIIMFLVILLFISFSLHTTYGQVLMNQVHKTVLNSGLIDKKELAKVKLNDALKKLREGLIENRYNQKIVNSNISSLDKKIIELKSQLKHYSKSQLKQLVKTDRQIANKVKLLKRDICYKKSLEQVLSQLEMYDTKLYDLYNKFEMKKELLPTQMTLLDVKDILVELEKTESFINTVSDITKTLKLEELKYQAKEEVNSELNFNTTVSMDNHQEELTNFIETTL